MRYEIPKINDQFVCICDAEHQVLGAVISSYVNLGNSYFALFEFPGVTAAKHVYDVENMDEHTFSQHRANHFEVLVNNVLARMEFKGTMIMAGLSTEQKSFIKRYPSVSYIEIDTFEEVDFYLSPYFPTERTTITCRPEQALVALHLALQKQKVLSIDSQADTIELEFRHDSGIVVIEDEQKARSLTAVNYAYTVKADILIVESLGNKGEYDIQQLLSDWDFGSYAALKEIEERVNQRIGEVEFHKYKWATFFTQGLPYSLVIKNIISCTYISCHYSPDLFIANAILFENNHFQGGAIVFSPLFFQNEETKFVGDYLYHQNYYVRGLIGEDARVNSLRMHLIEFPYDIFHLCSHGGELNGDLIAEQFTDRFGVEHTVEYENVSSFSAGNTKGMISVQQLNFPKKLDGKIWGSKELVDVYPHEVFSDMHNSMRKSPASKKTVLKKDIIIANSSHIQCADSPYLPLVQTIACHTSPIIFNNSCTSWFNMAMPFLSAGCRAYVGTLCRVSTKDAADFAKAVYLSTRTFSIADSLQAARTVVRGRKAENIYVMWGLHFSRIYRSPSYYEAKRNVFAGLSISLNNWTRGLQKEKTERVKKNIKEFVDWIGLTLQSGWTKEEREQYRKELKERK